MEDKCKNKKEMCDCFYEFNALNDKREKVYLKCRNFAQELIDEPLALMIVMNSSNAAHVQPIIDDYLIRNQILKNEELDKLISSLEYFREKIRDIRDIAVSDLYQDKELSKRFNIYINGVKNFKNRIQNLFNFRLNLDNVSKNDKISGFEHLDSE